MLFEDTTHKIYFHFQKEFAECSLRYQEFIKTKDIGVVFVHSNNYNIVDNKKWVFSRIKYGF